MILRLARAYGVLLAAALSTVAVVVGVVVQQKSLGVTRYPMPLVWPLSVLHVTFALLPLREVLGPAERVAARGRTARAIRGGVVLALLGTGAVSYVPAQGNATFRIFYFALAAVGFGAAGLVRSSDPWAWTLGVGMAAIGIEFITPWLLLQTSLGTVPGPVAVAVLIGSAAVYVLAGGAVTRPGRVRSVLSGWRPGLYASDR